MVYSHLLVLKAMTRDKYVDFLIAVMNVTYFNELECEEVGEFHLVVNWKC